MNALLENITSSFQVILPELILGFFLIAIIIVGLFKPSFRILTSIASVGFLTTILFLCQKGLSVNEQAFNGSLKIDGLSVFLKILMNVAGLFTCLFFSRRDKPHNSEYFALLFAVVLGGHFLVMTSNFLIIFLSMELMSIASFILAGFSFSKAGSEGSLKYFLFGAVASAVMLYGFSILYGFSGSIDFGDDQFYSKLSGKDLNLITMASLMVLGGLFYKITASPFHLWAPDVYDAAPISVIAFLSVAPKLAGLGVLFKFIMALHAVNQHGNDWQLILAAISILTITIGNFSALKQTSFKRLMAYSSISHSGFLMIGIVVFLPIGIHFMLFYACIYLLMNFLVFFYLDFFQTQSIHSISDFKGLGKIYPAALVLLLVGLISLTGLPPTSGFTAKLLIFSSLWQSYEISGKSILAILLIFGLLNTVISIFYYLRIPYFAFLKSGETPKRQNIHYSVNLLGAFLVVLILIFFFFPGVLMGWINKINFVL